MWLGLCLGILLTIQISDPLASPLQVLAIGGRPGLSLSQVLSRLSVLFLGLGCYVRFLDALCLEWETPELRRLLRWSTLLQMLSPLLGVLALPPMYVSLPQPLLRLGSALGSAGLLVVTGYLARQAGQEPIEAMISTRRVVRS
ncbi:MAG: hypothetical protein KF760_02100 [Candidatus Eremiobacteraeota bacterium]|nr:hypothetical protein [Candidatus Eremiobacteraeota bacterium]